MNEQQARSVLLVRALEENDSKGEVLSQSERLAASREARPPEPEAVLGAEKEDGRDGFSNEEWSFVIRRAEILREVAERRFPAVRTGFERTRWHSLIPIMMAGAAFILGVLSNELGAEKRVNILAFPLLGMLVWNLAVYFVMVLRWIRALMRDQERVTFSGPLARAAARWIGGAGRPKNDEGTTGQTNSVAAGLARFASDWISEGRRLHILRARVVLHLSAAALALGTIAGMYLRGMGFEYLAGWESTFLGSDAVHRLLVIVLGPASWLTGIGIPDEAAIASLRWRAGFEGENAARWIHLYAATAGLVILAPRLILAGADYAKQHRLAGAIRISGGGNDYFARLFKVGQGGGKVIRVAAYGFEIEPANRERLRAALYEWFGWKAQVDFADAIAYGAEDEFLQRCGNETGDASWAIVFNLASTPEPENHGRLLAGLKDAAGEENSNGDLMVVLDESSYLRRFAESSGLDKRLEERRRLWNQFIEGHGVKLAKSFS